MKNLTSVKIHTFKTGMLKFDDSILKIKSYTIFSSSIRHVLEFEKYILDVLTCLIVKDHFTDYSN